MRRICAPALLLALACTAQPSASERGTKLESSDAPNEPHHFEIGPGPQPEPLSAAVIDAPIPSERPPLDFWLAGDAACEAGGRLDGAVPPDGIEIRCVDAHGHWTGLEARFHDNGKLQMIGRKHDGRMLGVWSWFHPSGAQSGEQTYVDGQLHGHVRRFADNGQEVEYGEYRGGRPWGLFVQRDEHGNQLASAQLVNGTGVLVNASVTRRTESDYVHGLIHGTYRVFDAEHHKLEESQWSGGEPHGSQIRWNAEGQKIFAGQWKNGEQHGEFTRFVAEQISERAIWREGKEVARQLYRDGAPLAALPTPTACDTDAGLSKYLASARGRGLPDDHACITRIPLFPGVIMLGDFAYDRGCMGADFVVDCKLVTPAPSPADLLARAGWAKASGEQRIEIADEYIREFALGNNGSVSNTPNEPHWQVLDDGAVEGVVWVDEPAGMQPGVDQDQLRFTFAVDGTLKREVLQHLSARDD